MTTSEAPRRRVSRAAWSMVAALLLLSGCASPTGDVEAEAIETAEPAAVGTPTPTATPTPIELLRVPFSNSNGYKAVAVIEEWQEKDEFDVSACPAIQFGQNVATHAIVISGHLEYPSVNGFTWVDPVQLTAGSREGDEVLDSSGTVFAVTCGTPVSSPNSASSAPKLYDDAFVIPPASEFEFTIVYASETSPNYPDGRFAELGMATQYRDCCTER